jgi:hypothetical protein
VPLKGLLQANPTALALGSLSVNFDWLRDDLFVNSNTTPTLLQSALQQSESAPDAERPVAEFTASGQYPTPGLNGDANKTLTSYGVELLTVSCRIQAGQPRLELIVFGTRELPLVSFLEQNVPLYLEQRLTGDTGKTLANEIRKAIGKASTKDSLGYRSVAITLETDWATLAKFADVVVANLGPLPGNTSGQP